MFIFQILFQTSALPKEHMDSFLDDADFYIRSLRSNGQLISQNDVFLFQENTVSLHVQCLRRDSLDKRYNNDYVNQWIYTLMDRYGVAVTSSYVGEHPVPVPTADLDTSNSLILFSGILPPVRSGDTFDPIPLYALPYTHIRNKSFEDIHSWANTYDEIYNLWFRGSLGDQAFHDYLSGIESSLTTKGREICTRLEELTGKPSYYHLFNYNNNVMENACPSCGGEWRLAEKKISSVDLQCDPCRLVSLLSKD
ncbi:DUF2310 family Zn-ribbon-containing protein [Chitinophaga agri]|uniref:Nucleic acid-binding protein n=1 Tax=Chitinophaga agri TaxID=2703787 RepID=A0A6B9Z9S4_9BACT|nr:DUF2310 family Zn-ribbon-containing protein [Chitinophaga agri]QHS58311.1 hypothetical protein GWR21_01490 [Chitinophaga agri]